MFSNSPEEPVPNDVENQRIAPIPIPLLICGNFLKLPVAYRTNPLTRNAVRQPFFARNTTPPNLRELAKQTIRLTFRFCIDKKPLFPISNTIATNNPPAISASCPSFNWPFQCQRKTEEQEWNDPLTTKCFAATVL